jgi:hypothetical protein
MPITARWNIVWQNESNQKRTAYRARADRAGGATQRSLLWPRQLDWIPARAHAIHVIDSRECNGSCNGSRNSVIAHVTDQGSM